MSMVCNASYSFNLFNLDVRECGQMSYKLCQGEKTSGILEVRFIRILEDVLEHASNTPNVTESFIIARQWI